MRTSIITMAAVATTAAVLVSCNCGQKIIVSNDTEISRSGETIELELGDIKGVTAENAVVTDASGAQVPSQIYTDAEGRTLLLFQADVNAGETVEYNVAPGERAEFGTRAYSRYVPERVDDYAWENDLVAGRIYGPALSSPRTFGCDIWLKCTDRLVIDDWFKKMDYHHNYGEGMDCYKVANTLGGGAIAPYSGEQIIIGDNYATQQHICDGPVRTEAVFTYDAIDVDGRPVTVTRTISLDAGSRFVKSVMTFNFEGEGLPVVLGAVLHNVLGREDGSNFIAFTEKASDSSDPDRDGNISVGLVLGAEAAGTGTLDSHAVIYATALPGQPMTSWAGSGWSQGGVESQEAWAQEVKDFAYAQANPLKVTVK
ncbi:MAG: DUF4861 family protein [Candidatus Cryptobacteroides sp.]